MPYLKDFVVRDFGYVLSERGFEETCTGYWVRSGIHVEIRRVCCHLRWEVTDYTWRVGRKEKTCFSGVGLGSLEYFLDVKIQESL